MIRTLYALAALLLTAAPVAAGEPAEPVAAVVRHDATGWTLDLAFDRDAPLWAFAESETVTEGHGWRLGQWTVETGGVVLETVDGRDVLRAADGGAVPRRVRLRMVPRFVDLQASYDPVMTFSTGATAWYSETFHLVPAASAAELAALPPDLGPRVDAAPARVTWSDADGAVLVQGQRLVDPESTRVGTYVLFGPAEVAAGAALVTVTDPGLPRWITTELSEYAPRVADHYAARLGPGLAAAPTVMMSWNGPTAGKTSMAGSVLPGLIVMTFEGEGVLESSANVRNMARWFIGHESAHFWLGQTVRYEDAADSWITEGGADLMAIRALEAVDPAYRAGERLQATVDECIAMADAPISTATDRGEHRAHYACGAIFALAAEAALKRSAGGDWFDFLRTLIDANRVDGVLTRNEWLTGLDDVSGDPGLRRGIETLLDQGSADAASLVAGLLDRAGVPHRREGARVILINGAPRAGTATVGAR